MIAGAGIRLHKVGVIVNALPTSTVHPGCTVDLGSNNTALVIVSHAGHAPSAAFSIFAEHRTGRRTASGSGSS